MNKIKTARQNYHKDSLENVKPDPIEQFEDWLQEACDDSDILEPNAMTVCTANNEGQPSARILLLRAVSEDGLEFYTNYESQKGSEIEENPLVALCFFWEKLERQVRIEGSAEKISSQKSDQYFNSRPLESRISAIVSQQSKTVNSRAELEQQVTNFKSQNHPVTRPQNWGGYLVRPNKIEFWQGRPNRLHDRIRYTLSEDSWVVERLYP